MASSTIEDDMLIYLEASPDELAARANIEIEELFSELIRASFRGHHLVLINRQCAEWAANNLSLSSRELAHLSFLRNAFTQKAGLRSEAARYISVGIGSFGLQLVGSAFQIGHVPLLRGQFLERATLLVENAGSDGEFVRQVFYAMRRIHQVKDFDFDVQNGGGSTIVPCFDSALQSKKVVVCMADSDLVAPSAAESATVRALRRTAQTQSYVGELFVTRCREIENHLSPHLISRHAICPQYPDHDKVMHLVANSSLAWLYFDLKHGFFGNTIGQTQYPQSVRQWIIDHFGDGEDISSVNIAGFGSAILHQFMRSGQAMKEFAKHVCSEDWRVIFGSFYDDMLWYFAAERRRAGV